MAELPNENTDLATVPYSVVVRWKDYLEKGVPLPYETPRDEFLNSPYFPTQYQLMQRWDELPQKWDIAAMYANPFLPLERQRHQLELMAKFDVKFLSSDEARAARHAMDIVTVRRGIEEIEEILQNGCIEVPVREGNAKDGYFMRMKEQRLLPHQIARFRITQAALIKLSQELDGEASQIILHQHSAVGVLEQAMRAAMTGRHDRDGFSLSDLQKVANGEKPATDLLPPESWPNALPPMKDANVIESPVVGSSEGVGE